MSKPIISIRKVSKKYNLGERQPYYSFRDTISSILSTPFKKEKLERGQFWALNNITFDVNQGDVLGVIGRNGAGKSTLLKILSRITPPTEGEIIMRGRVASLLEVGTGFHPELTGKENIYLNGAILGMKRWEINNKFKEIVEFAEVEKFLDTPVKHYSSGMYMRLAFAVAAHLEPEILLVDEVLSVGDVSFQKKCLNKMSSVSRDGRTIVYVSHNMDSLVNLCNRAIIVNNGKLTSVGTPKELVSKYISDSESSTKTIFSERRNQYSDKKIVDDIFIYKDKGISKEVIEMGGPVKIVVKINIENYDKKYLVGIIFKSVYGQILMSTNTGMNTVGDNTLKKGEVVLSIEKFPLTPGKYFIDISITDNKYSRVDYVANALVIEVIDNDVYKSGYLVSNSNGVLYTDGYWYFL